MKRLAIGLALLVTAMVPASASAIVVPGINGPLIFTSGRDDGGTVLSDSLAQIWFFSGGAQRISQQNGLHHRHAAWSPDRTKLAYARGASGFAGPWDIYVHDLTQPLSGTNPLQVTNTATLNEDRPSWSPDGTMLAYAKQKVAMGAWDVVTQAASGVGAETPVGVDASAGAGASGQFSRPQWSPDGSQIYYARTVDEDPGIPVVLGYDIYRSPANGTNVIGTEIVGNNAGNDYQPSLSPDGTKLCFTRDEGGDKDIVIHEIGVGELDADLAPSATPDFECAWSPDGNRIAFSRGAFGAGQLMAADAAGGNLDTLSDTAGRFDGNPDWTYNPRPVCNDVTVNVAVNGFVTIPLTCTDEPDPPSFQPNSPFDPDILSAPQNGNIGGLSDEDTVVYTPNLNFRGTDSFSFQASDGTSDSEPATVTINVSQGGGNGNVPGAAPELSALGVSPKTFRRGSARPSLLSAAKGTTISFTLNENARTTLSFRRARPGRRVGGRCVKPTRRNRGRRRCTRYVRAGSFAVDAKSGNNRVRFEGRLPNGKRLKLGRYRLFARASDADGRSRQLRTSFRIVRR